MKVLIDTNIVIDAIDIRTPFNKYAEELLLLAAGNKFSPFLTSKSICDIFYLAHRRFQNNEETKNLIRDLLSIYSVLDTKSQDCIEALESPTSDYEDAVMEATAKREKMDCIVSRNTQNFKDPDIPCYSPSEFLELISK